MARIDMRLENYEQIYDEVEQRRQSRRFALGFSAFLSTVYAPNTGYVEGAEEEIAAEVKRGTTILYALNHRSPHDPNVAQGAVWREKSLRSHIGSTDVLAKWPLFEGGKLAPVPRLTRKMGGTPVPRKKDHPDAPPELLRSANNRMTETAVNGIMQGRDLAVFVEGTCNEGDPTRLQMVNSGLAHIAHQAMAFRREEDPEADPWFIFLPVGISYGIRPQPSFREARHASVIFGSPIKTLEAKPFQTTKVMKMGMEAVLAAAHEDYHARRGEDVPVWKDETDTLIA